MRTNYEYEHLLDMNALNDETPGYAIHDCTTVSVYVKGETGTHSTHVITLEIFTEPNSWIPTSHTITGVGSLPTGSLNLLGRRIKAKVTTVEGSASTATVYIMATRA